MQQNTGCDGRLLEGFLVVTGDTGLWPNEPHLYWKYVLEIYKANQCFKKNVLKSVSK
jgi:hypothetical protein